MRTKAGLVRENIFRIKAKAGNVVMLQACGTL